MRIPCPGKGFTAQAVNPFVFYPFHAKLPPKQMLQCRFDKRRHCKICERGGNWMKKQDRRKDNIILFPGLSDRLISKGMELLQEKKFRQAADALEQAVELEPESPEGLFGLTVAYFETGRTNDARDLAAEMLRKGIGEYHHVLDLYLMILVQNGEYKEIVSMLTALFEEGDLPREKSAHYEKMLEMSLRMSDGNKPVEEVQTSQSHAKELNLVSVVDPDDQMRLAAQLSNLNIRIYMEEIKEYLAAREGSPMMKSMLLNILKDQEFDGEVTVEKFGEAKKVIPQNLPEIHEMPKVHMICGILEEKLESENPSLLGHAKGMAERNFFLLYPFESSPPGNPGAWAAAYHHLVCSYYGAELPLDEAAQIYGITVREVESALEMVTKIEEISYPVE